MREDWIIGICNTKYDEVEIYRFYGTENEVKEKLVELVLNDAKDDEMDFGSESVAEVSTHGRDLYAYGVYTDYHIDYSAKRFSDVYFL